MDTPEKLVERNKQAQKMSNIMKPDRISSGAYAQEVRGHFKLLKERRHDMRKTHEAAEMLGRGKPYGHKGD